MIGRPAPFGVYEGAFASRNPVCTLTPNTVVGASDIAVGRFDLCDPVTNEVSNSQIAGAALGIVQPRIGLWSLTYTSGGVRYLRTGKPVTVYSSGDFYVRLPNGAAIGASVWADPSTGIGYAVDGGGFELTNCKVVTNVSPGALGIISYYSSI